MAISPQQLTIYLTSAHRAAIFAIAQLFLPFVWFSVVNIHSTHYRGVTMTYRMFHLSQHAVHVAVEVARHVLVASRLGIRVVEFVKNRPQLTGSTPSAVQLS